MGLIYLLRACNNLTSWISPSRTSDSHTAVYLALKGTQRSLSTLQYPPAPSHLSQLISIVNIHIGKGKGLPGTGREGPEREYSSTLSLTSALDGDVWSTPRPGSFIPGKDPILIVQRAG
jgi:hypothetical protein